MYCSGVEETCHRKCIIVVYTFLRSEIYERTNMAAADGPNIDERILLLS